MTASLDAQRGPQVLTAALLAARLGVARRWIYAQVEEHGLPAIKVGRTLLFDPVAVDAWLRSHRIGAWPKSCAAPNENVELEHAAEAARNT